MPTLYTALSAGANATSPTIYGHNTNTFVLAYNEIVEIVVNSNDPGKHPFHLHGHAFQVVARGDDDAGPWTPDAAAPLPAVPIRRDTILVRPNSHAVLRFRASNPGVWLFHCHIEWHMASGLIATMVEAPLALQDVLTLPSAATQTPVTTSALAAPKTVVPQSFLQVCALQGVPVRGNAAGNADNWFDLTGENAAPPPLPDGFTARGIVALVFSCLSALIGVAVIAW